MTRQTVAEGGEFRFTLPPGAYRLAVAGGAGKTCQAREVTVAASSELAVDLVCQLK